MIVKKIAHPNHCVELKDNTYVVLEEAEENFIFSGKMTLLK